MEKKVLNFSYTQDAECGIWVISHGAENNCKKKVPIFFYSKIQTSINKSIDGFQPTCRYQSRVSRGPLNTILVHALVELV